MTHRLLLSVVACGLLVSSCGGEAVRQLPSAGAVALPATAPSPPAGGAVVAPSDRSSDDPQQLREAASESVEVAQPETPASPATPGLRDVAAFVDGHRIAGATTLEHVVMDLDGDEVSEVVFTAVADGRAVVQIAWWGSDGYQVLATGRGGVGRSLTSLQVFDLTLDGNPEVVVEVTAGSRSSLSLWSVRGRGVLLPLQAQGGCHDGSHVYGVVGARILQPAAGVPGVLAASCDDSPLPVRDWSEQRWSWRDGAFRLVPGSVAPVPDAQQQRGDGDRERDDDERDDDEQRDDDDDDDEKKDKKAKAAKKGNGGGQDDDHDDDAPDRAGE